MVGRWRAARADALPARSFQESSYPAPYPDGWYRLATSESLRRGEARYIECLGRSLAVWRGEHSGDVFATEAFCPSQLAAGDLKPIKRLELMQDRRDIDAQLAALADEPDMTAVENGFVSHAANYGARKGISYATWREFGVPAELLGRAGITRNQ